MPQVNNIEHLRRWFRQCPALSPDNRFRVDYMAEEPTEYSLFAVPSSIRFRENVLGEFVPQDIQSVNYIFASKEVFGADESQNMANMGWYQDVTNWILDQNAKRNFPLMDEGRVISVRPTLSAYPIAPGVDSARYQIQIEVTFKIN